MLRSILTVLLLITLSVIAVFFMWQSDKPEATRLVQLCERVRFLGFDQESDRWVQLSAPEKSVIVCPIPGTTGDLKIEGLQQPFVDKPLPDQMIEVDCYKTARMKSGALPSQMPDGLYCNIPAVVN
jgi:hypothetical protein